jgi:hypothetical protein
MRAASGLDSWWRLDGLPQNGTEAVNPTHDLALAVHRGSDAAFAASWHCFR